MHKPESHQENETYRFLEHFEIKKKKENIPSNPDQKTRLSDSQREKPCWRVEFAVFSLNRMEIKVYAKGDNYLDLTRE